MDYVQPTGFQFIGQMASFLAPIPAAVVTIFSVLAYSYRNAMRWNLSSLLYFYSMFYLSGTFSIPRRFNLYPADLALGTTLAKAAAIFAILYLLGTLCFVFGASKRCLRAFSR